MPRPAMTRRVLATLLGLPASLALSGKARDDLNVP
jgi:hypothetical protein